MYYAPYLPLTTERKIKETQYMAKTIFNPFYNGESCIDIGDFILSHNSILMVTKISYTEFYIFYRCIDILHGGTKIIYSTYTTKHKSMILKGFKREDIEDILKIINHTLNTELVSLYNDLGKISINVINSTDLTNYSLHYIFDRTYYDIEAPLYVAGIEDNGYVLFNGKYLLTVNNDLKIENIISYFNFVCSLIDNDKYTCKNTITNIELNITEYFLNKKVIDLYEK